MPYHMFFGFDLREGVDVATADDKLNDLSEKLIAAGVLTSTAPLATRDLHPVLDTAAGITSRYFTTMMFTGRKQADAAVKLIYAKADITDTAHNAFIDLVQDPFFLCFED